MKTGKELKVANFKNYKVAFGSINSKRPKTVYINISAWAEPLVQDEVSYNRIIKNLNKKIKQEVFNYLDNNTSLEFVKNNTIVDLDIRESGIKFGKRSFLNCEITLFQSIDKAIMSQIDKKKLTEITNVVIKDILEDNTSFKFHRKKY